MYSNAQYAERAVSALVDRIKAGFATKLEQLESAYGLESEGLGRPREVLSYAAEHDNRPGLIEVWEEGLDPISQRENLWSVDCRIAIKQLGGSDLAANALQLRRWVTGMIELIADDPTLGDKVIAAIMKPGASAAPYGDRSAIRLIYFIPVEVHVQRVRYTVFVEPQ